MNRAWLTGVLFGIGCGNHPASVPKHDGTSKPLQASVAPQIEHLWSLAPKDATIGLVIGGDALILIDSLTVKYQRMMALIPGSRDLPLGTIRARILGSASSYDDVGIALDRGFAVFGTPRGRLVVMPVADRARFVTSHGGSQHDGVDQVMEVHCKPVGPDYACTEEPTLLDALGGGELGRYAGVGGHRGNIELVARLPPKESRLLGLIDVSGPVTAMALLSPGEMIVRGHAPGTVRDPLAALVGAPRGRVAIEDAAGFVIAPIGAFERFAPSTPLVAGLDLATLLRSLAEPLTISIASGASEIDARMLLSRRGPAETLLARCADLAHWIPASVSSPGTCRLGPFPGLPITAELWVDGDELRLAGRRDASPAGSTTIAPTLAGRELATYSIAAWGRGVYAFPMDPVTVATSGGLMRITELGIGADVTAHGLTVLHVARTTYANPDDVVTRIEAALSDGGVLTEELTAIARAYPKAPLALDVAAGEVGMTVGFKAVGFIMAVGVPAVLEHTKNASIREAAGPDPGPLLEAAGKQARLYHVTSGKFPVGTAGWTPRITCCKEPGSVCAPDATLWASDPIWRALGVSVDQPQRYAFWYKGTVDKFTLKAEADLNCSGHGHTKVWLQGRVENGGPVVEITRTVEPD